MFETFPLLKNRTFPLNIIFASHPVLVAAENNSLIVPFRPTRFHWIAFPHLFETDFPVQESNIIIIKRIAQIMEAEFMMGWNCKRYEPVISYFTVNCFLFNRETIADFIKAYLTVTSKNNLMFHTICENTFSLFLSVWGGLYINQYMVLIWDISK